MEVSNNLVVFFASGFATVEYFGAVTVIRSVYEDAPKFHVETKQILVTVLSVIQNTNDT